VINAFCFYFGNDSWSRHARQFFGAWRRQEPVIVSSWNAPCEGEALPDNLGEPSSAVPGIGLGPIERMLDVVGSRRIAYVVWETTIMPADKVRVLQSMDEVWTPSTWGRQLLVDNGIAPAKAKVVPEGVDADRFAPNRSSRGDDAPFRFLFVGKWEARKGVELLLRAYRREFRPDEPVELVLHAWNPYIRGFDLEASIRRAIGWRASAPVLASSPVTQEGLVRLYNSSDAFVLPTRAEGWGLPITEAMACGLPVIVTGYSAPLDFVDDQVGYLISVARHAQVRDRHFFPSGKALGTWAEPEEGSLRQLMRHVFENRNEAREKGRRGRARVCSQLTWDHAASAARRLLREPA
jgi:glycosyltransferase involved in cell wall biosynthesis